MSSSRVIAVGGLAIVFLITIAVIIAVVVIAIVAAARSGKKAAHSVQHEQPPSPVSQPIPQPVGEELQPAPEPEELSPAAPQHKLTLGEMIKNHRIRCGMTQEYVAESLNVSRQAVSKWETDSSDPSTSNLLALARLFGISAAELLDGIE